MAKDKAPKEGEGFVVGKRTGRYMGQPGTGAPGNPKGEYPYQGKSGSGSGRQNNRKGEK